MKILHINSFYQNNAFFQNLYDAQVRRGDELSVYVPVGRGFDAVSRDFGAYTRIETCLGKWDKPFFTYRYNRAIARAKATYDIASYDILHAHSLYSNGYVTRALAKEYGKPYLVAVRNCDVNHFLKYLVQLRPMAKAVLRDAAAVVFLSEPYRENALKPYLTDAEYRTAREKSVVVPNGVAQMWREQTGTPRAAGEDGIRLLQIGHINALKNPLTTAKAAMLLNERGHKTTLTVIGRHEDPGMVEKLRAIPCVRVLDPMPMAQLPPYYRDADVFVLPSTRETFGIVYAEAMTQALPVLYTRGQGFDGQYPDGEIGYGVSTYDAEMIADRVLDVVKNRLAMSEACVRHAAKYDWDDIAGTYARLYAEALE